MADVVAIIAKWAEAQGYRLDQDTSATWVAIAPNKDRYTLGKTPTSVAEMNLFITNARAAGIRWESSPD